MKTRKRRWLRITIFVLVSGLLVAGGAVLTVALLLRPPSPGQLAEPISIQTGMVQGRTQNGITIYKGIPFAAPPVGDLRWRAPQPVADWDGTLTADRFSPACIQGGETVPGLGVEPVSEDCLYLNVWTPAQSAADGLAVMVWLYGGGNRVGSGSARLYWGGDLAKRGVVVVTLNYRLGALGMFAHPELSAQSGYDASGNYLLLDQIAALHWVQDNISAFGGDPNNVTLFGQSAGTSNASKLTVSPLARGLFHRVIAHSGGDFSPSETEFSSTYSQAHAEQTGVDWTARFGVHSIAEMRRVPAEEIFANDDGAFFGNGTPRGPHRINIDNYVVTGDTYDLYAQGLQHDVDLLVGYNAGEDQMPHRWPIRTWALMHARNSTNNVFAYYFTRVPPFPPFRFTGTAGHGAELPYLFGYPPRIVFYFIKVRFLEMPWTAHQDYRLAGAIQSYWTNFAKTGDPNGAGLPHWPDVRQSGQVMELGDTIGAIDAPDRQAHIEMDAEMARLRGQP
ncbi:MAG: carboxylesterase family protein [Proteobacteria bacterium]|nr:carboxylesterase family protein [Pseudomonadota bacterium]